MLIDVRKLMLFLSLKYEGNYEAIIAAVKSKEKLTEEEMLRYDRLNIENYITITDSDYPERFKMI